MKPLLPESILILSVQKPPKLELKTLPESLKYVFLGTSETLPVIISSELNKEQEGKLIDVLKKHKEAI